MAPDCDAEASAGPPSCRAELLLRTHVPGALACFEDSQRVMPPGVSDSGPSTGADYRRFTPIGCRAPLARPCRCPRP